MTHRINLFSDCIFPSCPWKLYLLTLSIFYCLCQKSSFETRVPYEKVLYGRCYITALETFKLSELPFKMNNRLHTITLFAYMHAEFTNITECKPHWLSRFWRRRSLKTCGSQAHIIWNPVDSHLLKPSVISVVKGTVQVCGNFKFKWYVLNFCITFLQLFSPLPAHCFFFLFVLFYNYIILYLYAVLHNTFLL